MEPLLASLGSRAGAALFLAQLNEALSTIDRAEKASDRWLFLASIVIIMLIGAGVIRYLIKSLETKDKGNTEDRDALYAEIKTERAECRTMRQADQAGYMASLNGINAMIATHTKAIEALTTVVTKHDMEMRAAHEVELRAMIRSEIDKGKPGTG